MGSWRARQLDVLPPGIRTIHSFCASSHATAICAGVAVFRSANFVSHSMNAKFAFRFSGVKRGTTLRSHFCRTSFRRSWASEAFAKRTERHEPDRLTHRVRDKLQRRCKSTDARQVISRHTRQGKGGVTDFRVPGRVQTVTSHRISCEGQIRRDIKPGFALAVVLMSAPPWDR